MINESTMSGNMNHLNYNNYIDEPWTIISSYFDGKARQQLVRHQVE